MLHEVGGREALREHGSRPPCQDTPSTSLLQKYRASWPITAYLSSWSLEEDFIKHISSLLI